MKAATYLRNVWYAAALGDELADNLLRRTILDEPVMLFRDEETGAATALLDRCPHRFAPLSLGKRAAGGIQCPYHGLVFAASGKCILNPHGDGRILPSAKVRRFPTVERHGLVWIWPGDTALADEALVPDLSALDAADQRTRGAGHLLTRASYEVLTDNILDLSHADFLHPLLDSRGGTRQAAPEVKELSDSSLEVIWTWGPDHPMGFLAHMFEPGAQVHTRLKVRWHPPATMLLRITTAPGRDELESHISTESVHIMTPETARSTHYFWGGVRDFDVENVAFTVAFNQGAREAFSQEDKPMIEAVQMNMGSETDIFALRPLGLIGDAGGVRAREKLRQLIAAEQGAASTRRPVHAHS